MSGIPPASAGLPVFDAALIGMLRHLQREAARRPYGRIHVPRKDGSGFDSFRPADIDRWLALFGGHQSAPLPALTADRGPCLPVCGLAPTTHTDTLDGNERCDLCGHIAERNESDEMGALRSECDNQRALTADLLAAVTKMRAMARLWEDASNLEGGVDAEQEIYRRVAGHVNKWADGLSVGQRPPLTVDLLAELRRLIQEMRKAAGDACADWKSPEPMLAYFNFCMHCEAGPARHIARQWADDLEAVIARADALSAPSSGQWDGQAFELQLQEDAERLLANLQEGSGEHSVALDIGLLKASFRNLLTWALSAHQTVAVPTCNNGEPTAPAQTVAAQPSADQDSRGQFPRRKER